MMTKEELQVRIEKKEKDIEKINKRISKWATNMNDDAKVIASLGELSYEDRVKQNVYNTFKTYGDEHMNDTTVYNKDDWNKGPQFDELYRAYIDLGEAKATLNKYQVQLDKLVNFENEEKIEVLVEFLKQWKEQAYDYYCRNVELYFNLKVNERQAYNEWKNSEDIKDYMLDKNGKINRYYSSKWKNDYYSDVSNLTKEITRFKCHYVYHDENHFDYDYVPFEFSVDEEKLNKVLDEEVKAKYRDLVQRITKVTGVIQDCSNLHIGKNGMINGYVIGDKAKAKVETISACGPVQCFHYRTLVNIIK